MFGKKTEGGAKAKPLDILIDQIEKLAPGQQLMYRLAEMYGPEIIMIEVNKGYEGKGPKYAVIGCPPVDGKPGPKRHTIWETSKPKAIAAWLLGRNSTPYA